MDWNNLDLTGGSDLDACLIDPFTASDFLLQVSCNVRDITVEAMRSELKIAIESRVADAFEVFDLNAQEFLAAALSDRGI